jgi:hypothetical protein
MNADGGIVSTAEDTARFLYRAYAGQAARRGRRYKTNVWVSSDGSRVATLLLNGRAANQATGDMRPEQALAELYCPA